jgi:hypothetical protein
LPPEFHVNLDSDQPAKLLLFLLARINWVCARCRLQFLLNGDNPCWLYFTVQLLDLLKQQLTQATPWQVQQLLSQPQTNATAAAMLESRPQELSIFAT